jgi:hypothetical protein
MPKSEEKKLKKSARKAGLKGKDADAYVFGTMAKIRKARKAKAKRK